MSYDDDDDVTCHVLICAPTGECGQRHVQDTRERGLAGESSEASSGLWSSRLPGRLLLMSLSVWGGYVRTWQGRVYDCDFNQQLDMGLMGRSPASKGVSCLSPRDDIVWRQY